MHIKVKSLSMTGQSCYHIQTIQTIQTSTNEFIRFPTFVIYLNLQCLVSTKWLNARCKSYCKCCKIFSVCLTILWAPVIIGLNTITCFSSFFYRFTNLIGQHIYWLSLANEVSLHCFECNSNNSLDFALRKLQQSRKWFRSKTL